MSVFDQIKKTKETLKKASPFIKAATPPPVANPVANSDDGGKSGISITKDISNTVPENGSKDTSARKEGLELYMQEKRGARGNRQNKGGSSKGAVYTSGKFKGMSEGQADAIELREYREMKPEDRGKYNIVDEGDYETQKNRQLELEKKSGEIARENERLAKGGAPATPATPTPMSAPTPPPVTKPAAQTNRERGMGQTMDAPSSGSKETVRVSKPLDQLAAENSNKTQPAAPASTFQKPTANTQAPVSNPAPLTPQPMRKPESSELDRTIAAGASKMKADEAAAKKKANDDAILAPMRAERAAKEKAEINRKNQIATNSANIASKAPDASTTAALGQKMVTGANNNASYGNDKGATLDYISGRGATPPPVANVSMDDGSKQDLGGAFKPIPRKSLSQAIGEDVNTAKNAAKKAIVDTTVKVGTDVKNTIDTTTEAVKQVPNAAKEVATEVKDATVKGANDLGRSTIDASVAVTKAANEKVVAPVVNATKEVARDTASQVPGQTGKALKRKIDEL